MQAARCLAFLTLAVPLHGGAEAGVQIPVTNATVIAKCGTCHAPDSSGNMQYISSARATPDGWGDAVKRMIRANRVTLTPVEARAIVKYLSSEHGLTPEEAKPVMYYPERRVHDETGIASEGVINACAKCHPLARALSWRRSAEDWKQFVAVHAPSLKPRANQEAVAFLMQAAPFDISEWTKWHAHKKPDIAGRWLIRAHDLGHGQFYGEMDVRPRKDDGEFETKVMLKSVKDGSTLFRTGQMIVYDGYEWRGRSQGAATAAAAPDDLRKEARETMWVSPDGSHAEGRWFWGQYQEFGFDVKMQRASSGPSLLAVDPTALQTGARGRQVRLVGDRFPASAKVGDLHLGPGVTVERIVSSTDRELVAEVDVAPDAAIGERGIALGSSTFKDTMTIYDRVDYVKVTPESSMAAYGDQDHARGFQQYEAIGYQKGPDGRLHTADDLPLGPVDVTWSMEVFYEVDASKRDLVGNVNSTGFFTPAEKNPNINSDVWVIATATNERNKANKPLIGKGYLVVTVPTYSFNGHTYVRDLDRWIEEGSDTR